jgi:uncharacterized protein YpuA (DUF1002 family)
MKLARGGAGAGGADAAAPVEVAGEEAGAGISGQLNVCDTKVAQSFETSSCP